MKTQVILFAVVFLIFLTICQNEVNAKSLVDNLETGEDVEYIPKFESQDGNSKNVELCYEDGKEVYTIKSAHIYATLHKPKGSRCSEAGIEINSVRPQLPGFPTLTNIVREYEYKENFEALDNYSEITVIPLSFTIGSGCEVDFALSQNVDYLVSVYVIVDGEKYFTTYSGFRLTSSYKQDTTKPAISNVSVIDVDASGYTVLCTVTDDTAISKVVFPTWTKENGQDDLASDWKNNPVVEGKLVNNSYTFRVNDKEHNYERGIYYTHIYAYDTSGNYTSNTQVMQNVANTFKSVAKTSYGNNRYELYDDCQTWDDALNKAKAMGGHLVTVSSEKEQKAIMGLFENNHNRVGYWIGGYSDSNKKGCWITGEAFSYSNFSSGEPNQKKESERGYGVLCDGGKWVNIEKKANNMGFIVEYEGEVSVTKVIVNRTSASVYVGASVTLKATVTPSNATNKSVTWTSSNKTVATVSNSGVVRGIKAGTATITAKAGSKTTTCKVTVSPAVTQGMIDFVERMYTDVLGRTAEAKGLDYWTQMIAFGEETGASLGYKFVFSEEYTAKNTSDDKYVKMLYKVFMNRSPDADGYQNWISWLQNGLSREYVLKCFVESKEYQEICASYKMESGTFATNQARDRNRGLTSYLVRCYTKALGRTYDVVGLNYWADEVLNGRRSAREAAIAFIGSPEFVEKNLSDSEYVKVLYCTFFGREYEQEGYDFWMNELTTGLRNRDSVLRFFASSPEFSAIMASYGVK